MLNNDNDAHANVKQVLTVFTVLDGFQTVDLMMDEMLRDRQSYLYTLSGNLNVGTKCCANPFSRLD